MLFSRVSFWVISLLLIGTVLFGTWVLLPQKTVTFSGESDLTLSVDGTLTNVSGETVAFSPTGTKLLLQLRSEEEFLIPDFTIAFPDRAQGVVEVKKASLLSVEIITVRWIDTQTLKISSVLPLYSESLPAIELIFPEGYIEVPLRAKIVRVFTEMPLPLAAGVSGLFLLVGYLLIKASSRERTWRASGMRDVPPAYLTAMQIAVLHHSTIKPNDFTALLLELARKGAIEIIDKENRAVFLRKPYSGDLTTYEQGLLALIFAEEGQTVDLVDVLERLDKELFSAVASQLYIDIYGSFRNNGYYKENPRTVHLRSKLLGIFIQAVGLMGIVMASVLGVDSWLLGLLSAALFLLGVYYFIAASRVNLFSESGKKVIEEVSAFMRFLAAPQPVIDTSQGSLFFAYLPYALVLGLEYAWLERCKSVPVFLPDWLITTEATVVSPERFVEAFRRVGDDIAEHIVAVKDPNAD